jgi:hypothetical protein
MRRALPGRPTAFGLLIALALVTAPPIAGAQVQTGEEFTPVDAFLEAVNQHQGSDFIQQFVKDSGLSQQPDDAGDFLHSTGEVPGYTPDHIDITNTYWGMFGPPPPDSIFAGEDDGGLWQQGSTIISPPPGAAWPGNLGLFTNDVDPAAGSAFSDGGYSFRFELAAPVPLTVPGRCEYVVWINDDNGISTFPQNSSFPLDPAIGTNVAIGLGLNPDGTSGAFMIEHPGEGGFFPNFDVDVRVLVMDDQLEILAPRSAFQGIANLNFYAFCVEEGITYAPDDTGADQTFLIPWVQDKVAQWEVISAATVTPPTTVAPPTTQVAAAPPTPPAAAPLTTGATAEPTQTGDGGFGLLAFVLIGLGIVAVAIGGRLFFAKKGDPCADLLLAWQRAQAACDQAREAEKKAKQVCDKAKAQRGELEQRTKNLCREWPPACETDDGAFVESEGRRVTSIDLHARKVAMRALWDRYTSGQMTAEELEENWERADTPQFREEMRKETAKKKAEKTRLEKDLEQAQTAEKQACADHATSKAKADEACAKAEVARKAYEDCVKEQNAKAFVDAVMHLGEDQAATPPPEPSGTSAPGSAPPIIAAAATDSGTEAPQPRMGPVPMVLDKTGLSGNELKRAERLERIFGMRKGTCDKASVAMDLYQFDQWHQQTFEEPWLEWTTKEGPGTPTSTSRDVQTFMQTRKMACYEFVHFCAFICSDQIVRQRMGGPEDGPPVPLDEYSVPWGFDDDISTNPAPLKGNAPRGSVITGVSRWGYNNDAGYYHTGIEVGDGWVVSLGSDGLLLEQTTGTVGGAFPSVGYSEVQFGDYNYGRNNPPPAAAGN